jgi:hypothetical protein
MIPALSFWQWLKPTRAKIVPRPDASRLPFGYPRPLSEDVTFLRSALSRIVWCDSRTEAQAIAKAALKGEVA